MIRVVAVRIVSKKRSANASESDVQRWRRDARLKPSRSFDREKDSS